MSKAELQQHLEQLHTDLTELQGGDVDQLDERTRALIEQIREDLDGLESHEAPHATGLRERLADAARALETTHPTLSGFIRGVGDILSQSGI